MHRQDGRQEIDRRTLLAKGAAFAALLVTGCARKESRGFAATSLRQLRASDESDHDFCASSGRGHRSCCCNGQLALGGLRFFSTSSSVIIIIIIGSTGHS
jgi:hypothetical protein